LDDPVQLRTTAFILLQEMNGEKKKKRESTLLLQRAILPARRTVGPYTSRLTVVLVSGAGGRVIAVGEAREPAASVKVSADADEVLEAAVVGAEPSRSAARSEAGGGHAPDTCAAVGASHAGLERRAVPHEPRARAGAHEPAEHAAVGADVVVAGDGVLARVGDVEQVPRAAPRQEAPPGGLGEAGDGREVARHAGARRAAAEEEQLRERRPPAADPPRRGGPAPQRRHHARGPGDAELAPQDALRHRAQAAADARHHAEGLGVPVEEAEHQHQHLLVHDPRVHAAGPRRIAAPVLPLPRSVSRAVACASDTAAVRRAAHLPHGRCPLAHPSRAELER
jgi:hypothetical protein